MVLQQVALWWHGTLSCPVSTLFPLWAISCRVPFSTWVGLLENCPFYQRSWAAAQLSVLPALKKCCTDCLGLAVSPLRVSVSFYIACWRASLLLMLNRRCQSIICAEPNSLSPFPLFHTSLCLQPWRTSNSILAFRPHPSCLYQWLMFYFATLAKKIPFFWWVLLLR